jgi:hypothetical protein
MPMSILASIDTLDLRIIKSKTSPNIIIAIVIAMKGGVLMVVSIIVSSSSVLKVAISAVLYVNGRPIGKKGFLR